MRTNSLIYGSRTGSQSTMRTNSLTYGSRTGSQGKMRTNTLTYAVREPVRKVQCEPIHSRTVR